MKKKLFAFFLFLCAGALPVPAYIFYCWLIKTYDCSTEGASSSVIVAVLIFGTAFLLIGSDFYEAKKKAD